MTQTGVALIGFVGALIVALVSLAGVWVGRLMERSNEATKWRRERCLEAYADVVATCHMVFIEANKTWNMADPTTPEAKAQHDILTSKVTEMDRAGDKALLIGSPEINEAIRRLTDHHGQTLARRSMAPKPEGADWYQMVRDAGELHSIFLRQARKDLGFASKEVPTKDRLMHFDPSLL